MFSDAAHERGKVFDSLRNSHTGIFSAKGAARIHGILRGQCLKTITHQQPCPLVRKVDEILVIGDDSTERYNLMVLEFSTLIKKRPYGVASRYGHMPLNLIACARTNRGDRRAFWQDNMSQS
jgi:hypothetical protein